MIGVPRYYNFTIVTFKHWAWASIAFCVLPGIGFAYPIFSCLRSCFGFLVWILGHFLPFTLVMNYFFLTSHRANSKPLANITCNHFHINLSFTQFSRTIQLCTKVSMLDRILRTLKVVLPHTYQKFLMLTNQYQCLNTWLAYNHFLVAMLEDACTWWWVYLIDFLLLSKERDFAIQFAC